ncbi:MAG: NUDIX domain-containing protein [Bacillota bacterium]|nr:NUDIX domain-containing protein [Bacillota bacterium]
MSAVRVSVRAVIIRDRQLLVTRNRDPWGDYYLLPGGGQHPGETMVSALQRECMEEIGVTVHVGDLLYVREYIGRNHEFAEYDGDVHQVELMFSCALAGEAAPALGSNPDANQVSVVWLDLDELGQYRLYPAVLKELIPQTRKGGPVYLGDVN